MQDASFPAILAQICDTMRVNDTTTPANSLVCQGFSYNIHTKTAYFKGQQANTSIDLSTLCYHPNQTLWLLNAGQFLMTTM